jgi:hypothetical protein
MGIAKPYYRVYRPFVEYSNPPRNVFHDYVWASCFAPDAGDFVRAGKLVESDLVAVFDYVEPADDNLNTYSHRLAQLLLRACTEVEANAKAILKANGYVKPKAGNLNIEDYWEVEKPCRLSEYAVVFPIWRGKQNRFCPFANWSRTHTLPWYQAYNNVKHDRTANFQHASLGNVLDAVAGMLVILFAQFFDRSFNPYRQGHGMTEGYQVFWRDGSFFEIVIPTSWTDAEKYEFDWEKLMKHPDPVQQFPF